MKNPFACFTTRSDTADNWVKHVFLFLYLTKLYQIILIYIFIPRIKRYSTFYMLPAAFLAFLSFNLITSLVTVP